MRFIDIVKINVFDLREFNAFIIATVKTNAFLNIGFNDVLYGEI